MSRTQYNKEYYQNNKERIKQMYSERAEERREYARKYREEHPEYVLESNKKYRESGKAKLANKKWRTMNLEKSRQICKDYKKSHPDKVVHYERKRRARKSGCWGNFSLQDWYDLCDFYGNICLCCKRDDVKLTIDHIVPLSLGGIHIIENIQPLCRICNMKKHTKIIDYRNGKIFNKG